MTPERLNRIHKVLAHRQNDLSVVLENVSDPHNISAVLRTCDAVGIQDVFVLNTQIPKHQKFGDRSSSSANKWVNVHQFTNLESCILTLRKKFDNILCAYLDDTATLLYDLDLTKKTALVFGNEIAGVSQELKKHCNGSFIIPQMGMIKSLNISVACAITIYEAYRQKNLQQHYDKPKLALNESEALFKQWAYPQ